jgi:hypothetical protein
MVYGIIHLHGQVTYFYVFNKIWSIQEESHAVDKIDLVYCYIICLYIPVIHWIQQLSPYIKNIIKLVHCMANNSLNTTDINECKTKYQNNTF